MAMEIPSHFVGADALGSPKPQTLGTRGQLIAAPADGVGFPPPSAATKIIFQENAV